MKFTPADYIYQLCLSGFGKYPGILKTPLVEAVRFSNAMAKFERFHSGRALVSDLNGAEAEKSYLAKYWSKNK